jgi:hypothetical protein
MVIVIVAMQVLSWALTEAKTGDPKDNFSPVT